MGHVVVNISVKGEIGEQALTEVLVDTGATYTVLSPEVSQTGCCLENCSLRTEGVAIPETLCPALLA